jgi:hypothetical protein
VFQIFQRYVAKVFCINVAKAYQDVAYVAIVFSSVCPQYFIYFRRMLQVFYLDVAKVELHVAYTCMLQVYISSVSSILGVLYVC